MDFEVSNQRTGTFVAFPPQFFVAQSSIVVHCVHCQRSGGAKAERFALDTGAFSGLIPNYIPCNLQLQT